MTPTSEERREVAGRLRNDARFPSSDSFEGFFTRLNEILFGDEGGERPDGEIFERLADLIDPTCHMCPAHAGGFGCDRCFTWFPDTETKPSFCPSCGARVVNCDGD